MALVTVNRVSQKVAATGTGAVALAATAQTGFRTLAAAGVADASTVYYTIEDGVAWECGLATYTAGTNTIARTVLISSNGNAAINLTLNAVFSATLLAEGLAQFLTASALAPYATTAAVNTALASYLLASASAVAADVRAGTDTAKFLTAKSIGDAQAFQALTDAATIAWDGKLGFNATVTLAGNRTLGAMANPVAGQTYTLLITQDATGSRTLAYSTAYDFGAAGAPTLSTGTGLVDMLSLICVNAATPRFFAVLNKGF